jgi:hypothetical protein
MGDALCDDVLRLIFDHVRETCVLGRIKLRQTCRAFYEADPVFCVPAWTVDHQDLEGVLATEHGARLWTAFVAALAKEDFTTIIPRPSHVGLQWNAVPVLNSLGMELVIQWPSLACTCRWWKEYELSIVRAIRYQGRGIIRFGRGHLDVLNPWYLGGGGHDSSLNTTLPMCRCQPSEPENRFEEPTKAMYPQRRTSRMYAPYNTWYK